jgi:hypothetical protein
VRCIIRMAARAAVGLAVAAVLAGTGCSSPGSPGKATVTSTAPELYPVAAGNSWKYKVTADGGSGTVTNKMTSVVPVTSGRKVTMTLTSTIPGAPARGESVCSFRSDGSVTCSPLPQAGHRNVVTITGSDIRLPSAVVIDSGRPLKLAVPVALKGAERTYRTMEHITLQSTGTTTITVPAGTYQTTIVSETTTMSFFGIGRPVTFSYKTWLAPGVGPVREQLALINTAGSYHVMATIVLESFSKG